MEVLTCKVNGCEIKRENEEFKKQNEELKWEQKQILEDNENYQKENEELKAKLDELKCCENCANIGNSIYEEPCFTCKYNTIRTNDKDNWE